jgi:hypothetical protein
MPFVKTTWVDGSAPAITATQLNRIEDGVGDAHSGAIDDGSIATAKLADGAVTNAKIASGVDAAKLTTGTLPIARIANGAVSPAKTSFATDLPAGVSALFAGRVLLTGTALRLPAGWTVTKSGTGVYVVTHNTTVSLAIAATVTSSVAAVAVITERNSASFEIRTFNAAGTAVDESFDFVAHRY